MNCPICNASISDDCRVCPACGADVADAGAAVSAEFIFCEGCGARLSPQDRTCPKCGRPAPGILSQDSAASDLAAGRTASFPRISSEMIAGAVPAPAASGKVFTSGSDADSTSVIDADALHAAREAAEFPVRPRGASHAPLPHVGVDSPDGSDPFAKRRSGRWAVFASVLVALLAGAWFVSADPLGVMPGFYESFGKAASDMFPSRQVPEEEEGGEAGDSSPDDSADDDGQVQVSDSVLSEAEAFQRLSALYGQIVTLTDEIGPVVETFNGQYLVKDRAQREQASQGAYELRDSLQGVIDELDALKLADDSAYLEDVDHLRQLATWTYNRVDVLCRSWDINLALPEGESPSVHQDEILAPLREVEKVDGKAVDVVRYEENVAAWKPVEK